MDQSLWLAYLGTIQHHPASSSYDFGYHPGCPASTHNQEGEPKNEATPNAWWVRWWNIFEPPRFTSSQSWFGWSALGGCGSWSPTPKTKNPPEKKSIRSRKVKYYWSHELPSHVFLFWGVHPKIWSEKSLHVFFFFFFYGVNEFRYVEKQIHSMFFYWCTLLVHNDFVICLPPRIWGKRM